MASDLYGPSYESIKVIPETRIRYMTAATK